ncbi:MAG: baeRF10 domain-containing protein [Candidatus Dormibacteria bacterium]
MAATIVRSRIDREIGDLQHVHDTPIVTTCYLDVDGGHRPRRADYLQAFKVLAQTARESAAVEKPEVRAALDGNVTMLERWLEEQFTRSHTRGLVLAACSRDSWLRASTLPVRVEDQIVSGHGPNLTPLELLLAGASRFGVTLVDHEKMRIFDYYLGELFEYPALFEGPALHRDRQRGWNVSSSPSGTGDAAAQWASAGTHVDRRDVALAERHIARCAAALASHLDAHPVDHLILGGPTPERMRLERHLPDRFRARVAGHVGVRVSAPIDEIQTAVAAIALEVEHRA